MIARYEPTYRMDPRPEDGDWVHYEDHLAETSQLQARVAELEATLQMVRAVHESNTGAGRDSWVEVRRVLGVK